MQEDLQIMLNDELLSKLLRSNLSCYLGKEVTVSLLEEMCLQIIDSINYFLNKKDEI